MKARFDTIYTDAAGHRHATFTVGSEITEAWDELKDAEIDMTLKKHRRKRSLSANAYCWVLLDKLSEKLMIPKDDLYRNMIRNIGGVSTTVEVLTDAVETLISTWSSRGTGWFVERFPSINSGFTVLTLYYGSSAYDSRQMAALIDSIVQECKEQGVETATQAELEMMKEEWNIDSV